MEKHQVDLVAIGDSITYGYPYSPKVSWVRALQDLFPRGVVNQGSCGDTISGMLARFQEDVLSYQPEYVIIMGGVNDVLLNENIEDILYNLKKMVTRAQREDITPIIGIPIPCDDDKAESQLNNYRTELYAYCEAQGITYIDFYRVMTGINRRGLGVGLYSDEFHPSASGYRVMGKLAQESLEELLSL